MTTPTTNTAGALPVMFSHDEPVVAELNMAMGDLLALAARVFAEFATWQDGGVFELDLTTGLDGVEMSLAQCRAAWAALAAEMEQFE